MQPNRSDFGAILGENFPEVSCSTTKKISDKEKRKYGHSLCKIFPLKI
jgi:hypothetical protein